MCLARFAITNFRGDCDSPDNECASQYALHHQDLKRFPQGRYRGQSHLMSSHVRKCLASLTSAIHVYQTDAISAHADVHAGLHPPTHTDRGHKTHNNDIKVPSPGIASSLTCSWRTSISGPLCFLIYLCHASSHNSRWKEWHLRYATSRSCPARD